ncbi:spindle pole body-associated protein sad1 [Ophiocordyceps camponoti-floridani]|uniref:Spindle pole body-associated protein sad1 n=1 Tax=Ophiocordyceps camponoti-floridani TaxID=2030778 RepID=A0A8H4VBP8_9HYPO|nr:spindle pole body-associated protein sad1 [Ophiocordyceps camponoti-floridani]
MPPKTSAQRWPRMASGDSQTPTPSRGGLAAFQKLNLPPLEGTPSSRRQYSYGAAAEPQPARPGRGLQRGQELNLSNAIRSALSTHADDELRDEELSTLSQDINPDETEPAGVSGATARQKPTTRTSRHGSPDSSESFGRPSQIDNEAEDSRSFGVESDYYGNATIRSSPAEKRSSNRLRTAPGAAKGQADSSTDVRRRGKGPSKLRTAQSHAVASERDGSATANPDDTRPRTRSRTQALSARVRNPRAGFLYQAESSDSSEAHGSGRDDGAPDNCSRSGRWLSGATASNFMSNFSLRGSGDATPVAGPRQGDRWWQHFTDKLHIYLQTVVTLLCDAWQWMAALSKSTIWADARLLLAHATRLLPGILMAVLVLVSALVLSAGWRGDPNNSDLWESTSGGTSWYSPTGMTHKLGAYLGSLHWPSHSRWDDLDDLWSMDDWQRSSVEEHVRKIERAFRSLKEASKLHELSLKKLESVVPRVVHMELRDGKPVVASAFWHALRDLIHEDGTMMTFDEDKQGAYTVSSERQWRALASRLTTDGSLARQIDSSVGQAESRLEGKLTHWEAWIRENDAKRRERSDLDRVESAAQQHKWEKHVVDMLEERIRDYERRNVFVSRDEYLSHVQREAASHGFAGELDQLQPQLEKMVRESIRLAAAETPQGMSRNDVTALVNGLVRKAFSDVNLEALANGKIHHHWQTELSRHVNYFSLKAGARVDRHRSSPDFGAVSDEAGHRVSLPPTKALEPWHDDGDCWCAAHSRDRQAQKAHGARLAVLLAHRIIPQHLVIEHIPPSATTDADARPREVELWAAIEDDETRDRLGDFAAAHFPPVDDQDIPSDLRSGFVKIAHTVYRSDDVHGGVHVHRLSHELVDLGAVTDHVVVRAVSNHGAADYTCFYRLRLFGRNVDADVVETEWT